MSHRVIRPAPDPGVFNARKIPVAPVYAAGPGPWWRLSKKAYASEFYPNPGSRLTPASLRFPATYFAVNHRTIVGEVYGDKMSAAQEKGRSVVSIPIGEAAEHQYRRLDKLPDSLILCDLTDPDSIDAVGIDAATLFHTDLSVTQLWAERIATHPTHFDGIIYPSRHTFDDCVVLWKRPGASRDIEGELSFTPDGEFLYSKPPWEVARAKGLRLAFV